MRSDTIKTKNVFEYCTYVVREEEEALYRAAGVDSILAIPKGEVHDFMSTFYWIINHTPEDVICIVDDDIKEMIFRGDYHNAPIRNKDGSPDKETATIECERIAQLLYDLDLGLAFDNPQRAPYSFTAEFSFKGMPGHVRWVNKKCFKAKYNPKDPATSDIDMQMQELLLNRVVLHPLYYISHADIDVADANAEPRRIHIAHQYAMKNKWFPYYDYDFKKNQARIMVER